MLSLIVFLTCFASSPPDQYVILKADDWYAQKGTNAWNTQWKRYFDYLEEMGIKSSAGIIAGRLRDSGPAGIAYTRALLDSGMVEYWNHGWDHSSTAKSYDDASFEYETDDTDAKGTYEFQGTPYEYQLEHLQWAQQEVYDYFGVWMPAFGAPFNKTDVNTVLAFCTTPHLDIWYYPHHQTPSYILRLPRLCEIEVPTGEPNFAEFLLRYNPDTSPLVLQLHPGNTAWATRFAEFEQCIEFLLDQAAIFVTPTEYRQIVYGPEGEGEGEGEVEGEGEGQGEGEDEDEGEDHGNVPQVDAANPWCCR